MNRAKIYTFVVATFFLLLCGSVRAESFRFAIDQGEVVVTPAFCVPEQCESAVGVIRGEFTAEIEDDVISISSASIKSEIQGFTLPEDPNLDSGGTTREAQFSFDSGTLKLEGIIDSRAFDGPLYEYSLVAEVVDGVVDKPFDPDGFYLARQDFRKCASPMCGGLYLSSVNRLFMRCPDGRYASECYVGTIDWQALGGNVFNGDETLLLQGVLERRRAGEFGRFVVEGANRPVSDKRPRGLFFGVQGNGIVCITSPCFSFDQYLLNRNYDTTLSGVNLEHAGADKREVERAYNLMADGGVLLAAGYNRRTQDFAGPGKEFYATQFYLPVAYQVVEKLCPTGYSETDMGCATRHGCFYPDLELVTQGGAAVEDPVTGELVAASTYSCVSECEPPAEPISDGYCMLALP